MSGLKLAFVLWSGKVGGAETATRALMRALRPRGVESRAILFGGDGAVGAALRADGFAVRTLGYRSGARSFLRPARMALALREERADALVFADTDLLLPFALFARGRARRCAVLHRGEVVGRGYTRAQRAGALFRRVFSDLDLCVSDHVAGVARRAPHARRLEVLPNGVNTERFAPADAPRAAGPLVVGFAGRLIPGKGLEDAIAAFAAAGAPRGARLRVAGDGPLAFEARRLAALSGVGEAIEFLGLVEDMPAFWRGCDVVLAPSNGLVESFGMVPLEAMSCGKPVVASRAGGHLDIVVDGETGVLFAPGDQAALGAALGRYLDDPELRARHGAAGRRRAVESFDVARVAERFLGYFAATE